MWEEHQCEWLKFRNRDPTFRVMQLWPVHKFLHKFMSFFEWVSMVLDLEENSLYQICSYFMLTFVWPWFSCQSFPVFRLRSLKQPLTDNHDLYIGLCSEYPEWLSGLLDKRPALSELQRKKAETLPHMEVQKLNLFIFYYTCYTTICLRLRVTFEDQQ